MSNIVDSSPEDGFTFIYALVDPRDGAIRYVGKSNNPKGRVSRHLKEVANPENHTRKINWLRQLFSIALLPNIEILEKVREGEWQSREKYWICEFKNRGADLTNCTEGGDGLVGPSAETLSKMRESHTGKKYSLETRAKMSASHKGHIVSGETRLKASIGMLGKQNMLGHRHSDETRARIKSSNIASGHAIGNKNMLGYRHTPDAIEKMRIVKRALYALRRVQKQMDELIELARK